MSRLYRPFRNLFGSARIASRLQNGQTVRVERVRIKGPKSTARILGTALKGALAIQLFVWAVELALADDDDDAKKNKAGTTGNKSGAKGVAEYRFIPFPLTTKKHPAEPYSLRSPEWLEFVRISRDRKLQLAIREHTSHLVAKRISNFPALVRRVGPDLKVRRYWLDIDYPYRAPPVYERSGILVTDEAVEWASMPCDPWLARNLDHVLWPKPSALGSWAFGTATAKQTAQEVAKYFGFGSGGPNTQAPPGPTSPVVPSSPSPEVQKALQRIRQEATKRPEEVKDPGSMTPSARASPAAPSTPRDKSVRGSDNPASDLGKQETSGENSRATELILSLPGMQPWRRFKETYFRERGTIISHPPRGSIAVTGIVELETPRSYVLVDILTWYDPKTNSLAPQSTHLFIRRVAEKRQHALRP